MRLLRAVARPTALGIVVLAAVNLFAVFWAVTGRGPDGTSVDVYRIDVDVYRIAAQVWWHGGDLYGELPDTSAGISLPYLYPPFALTVLAPLAAMPFWLASASWTLLSIAALAAVIVVALRSLGVSQVWWLSGMLLPCALFIEPVRSHLAYGQINILLMALVALDCLVRSPRWPRGLLIGLAAAIKLTPLVFLLFLVLRRDHRAAVTAAVSFGACAVIGVLLSWDNSVRFWGGGFLSTDRVGSGHVSNQSTMAVLIRLGVEPPVREALWLALSAALVALAAVAVHNALADGRIVLAVGFNALAMLLVSPISWSHHWVWCVPLLLALAWHSRVLTAVGALLFFASVWWPTDGQREQGWSVWEQLTGNGYLLFAVVVLAYGVMRAAPPAVPATDPQEVRSYSG